MVFSFLMDVSSAIFCGSEPKLGDFIAKGAEADLYTGEYLGRPVIIKRRNVKKYRVEQLDKRLRKQRMILEAKILFTLRSHGIPVPMVLDLDFTTFSIAMSRIDGVKLRDLINEDKVDIPDIFKRIGELVHQFHGLGVIHGDLTTSNILMKDSTPFFIDFGLGRFSKSLEDRAVDLLVMKRTLESTHSHVFENAWNAFMTGYLSGTLLNGASVLNRLRQVELRARHLKEE